MSASLPLVSVIVPMRNEEPYIERCLQSLVEQAYPSERVEVIVLDGASTDNSREVVNKIASRSPFPIRLLDNPACIYSSAVNMGVKKALGEMIAIISAHSRLAPSFISEAVNLLTKKGVECVSGPITSIGESPTARAIALAMSSPFGVGNAVFRRPNRREQLVNTAAFALYRTDIFSRVGEFDERLDGGADVNFHYRLIESGGRILQSPKLESFYYVRTTFQDLFRQYFEYGIRKLELMRRYPRRTMPKQLIPGLLVAGLLTTGGTGIVSKDARTIFAIIACNYVMLTVITAATLASQTDWRSLPYLPLAFACLYIGQGLGLLLALVKWLLIRDAYVAAPNQRESVGTCP